MAVLHIIAYCWMIFQLHIITSAQDFTTLSLGDEQAASFVNRDGRHQLIENVQSLDSLRELSEVSGSFERLNSYEEAGMPSRKRRQITIDGDAVPLIVSDLVVTQHCHGIYLRWKKPASPTSDLYPYTNTDFSYYNVYRSKDHFTSIDGMVPYASGKQYFELSVFHKVDWMDRDPLTNQQVWYAVTIVNRNGDEFRLVSPVKTLFIGAFGPLGKKIQISSADTRGRVMNHAAIFNAVRNEYFVAYDVDTNIDGQPDRIYVLRLSPDGGIVGQKILDITVSINAVSQGWPSVEYSSLRNEYIVVFQLTSPSLSTGKAVIITSRILAVSFKIATYPVLQLKANERSGGSMVDVPVTKPHVIHNPSNGGFIIAAEGVALGGNHIALLHYTSFDFKGIKTIKLMNNDARSIRIVIDTKRNELYAVMQVPRHAFGDAVAPKLPYSIIVKKRSLSGDILPGGDDLVQAGETRLLDSSISCFYDVARDRLVVFWSDMIKGKRVVKSSRVLMVGLIRFAESLDKYQSQTCPIDDLRTPFAAMFPKTSGQLLVGETKTHGGYRLYGPLIKDSAFEFAGQSQKRPLLISNENGNQILAVWQEVLNGQQSKLFSRVLKADRHTCTACDAPRVCMKQDTCVMPFKGNNFCSRNNVGCNQICLMSYDGAKCSCKDGFELSSDKRTCIRKEIANEPLTMVVASPSAIWKARFMDDGSMKFDRLFRGESLVAVYVDEKEKLLYWSDVSKSLIYRGRLDGTNSEIFVGSVKSDGIFLDPDAGKVFWTDFLNKRIEVANTNRENRTPLVTSGVDKPRAITSCKQNGITYLYWTDWGSPSKIERVQLNSNLSSVNSRRTIISSGLGFPNGLAADCSRKRIYWTEAQLDKIEFSDLLGNGRQQLSRIHVLHPFSILTYKNSIYWTDWAGIVQQADKETGLNEKILFHGLTPRGLYIFKEKELSATDFQGAKCHDLLIPTNGNRNLKGNNIGDIAFYTCNPGYELIGNSSRKCLPGGVWSGDQPKCLSLPVFQNPPLNETAVAGKSHIFSCEATGGGAVKIKWLKDGAPFESKDHAGRMFLVGPKLIISHLRFSDAGKFTCVASNDVGTIKADAYLRVVRKEFKECGIPKFSTTQRIFGGRNAGAGAHPWIAMFWDKEKRRPFCGGSLISEQFVITAAHCVGDKLRNLNNVRVRFGKLKARRKAETYEQVKRIKTNHRNPHFNSMTYDSDIAVIELDSPVTFTDYVMPICLPNEDSDYKLLVDGATALVVGWGSAKIGRPFSKRLKEVDVPIIQQSECKKQMKYVVTDNMFCAGGDGDKDACKGDSGGPISMFNSQTKKHVLLGIVSWGDGCGKIDSFGIYTKLYSFMSWVNSFLD